MRGFAQSQTRAEGIRGEDTQRERHLETETEMGTVGPQAKESLGPPAAGRGEKETLWEPLEGGWLPRQ